MSSITSYLPARRIRPRLSIETPAVMFVAAFACIALGYVGVTGTQLFLEGAGLVAAVAVMIFLPRVGLFVLVLYQLGYGEIVRRAGSSRGPGVALLIAMLLLAASTAARGRFRRRLRGFPMRLTLAWLGFAALATLGAGSIYGGALGLRTQFEPILWLVLCVMLVDETYLRKALFLLTPVCVYEAYDFLHQSRVGVNGLLQQGYAYGTTVRQIGSTLRAFGTFAYDAPAGETMALLFLAYLGLLLSNRRGLGQTLLSLLALAACAACVVLSFDRTAIVTLVLGSIVLISVTYRHRPSAVVGSFVALAVLVVALSAAAPRIGQDLTGSSSALARLSIWRELLSSPSLVTGRGTGTAGVSLVSGGQTLSAGATANGLVVIDNYYLTQLVQEGLVGLVFLIAFLRALYRRFVVGGRIASISGFGTRVGTAVLVAMSLAMVVTNLWEETATPFIGFFLLSGGLAASSRTWASEKAPERADEFVAALTG